MKPLLKIAFTDHSTRHFRPQNNFLSRALAKFYELEFSDDPHVLFYSCFGREHLRYRCRRVFVTGENRRPDWRTCDYALTFDRTDHPRHLRLPNYSHGYGELSSLVKRDVDVGRILAEKTRFCNFIVSNRSCRERLRFFDKLSRYKRIDAPGKVRNNMADAIAPRYGGAVSWKDGKMQFIQQYKFTIAFESASYPGYTTEKLPQPMWADSLPIYWGDPTVHVDFNPQSFLNYFDYGSQEALIERVIAVDRDDDLYAEYLRQPWFHGNRVPEALAPERLEEFLVRIVETPRVPVAQQPRRSWFGGAMDWLRGTRTEAA